MKRQKTVWMLVSALALTMAGVLGARADEPAPPPPTLTISGAGTKVPISHAMRFQADLTAVVDNAPKSTDEATITGPTWKWSGGNGSVQFISTTDNPATLDSGDPPVYPGTQTTPLFVVPVSCTATYISTNKKTGAETPITASKDDAVQFVVLWPTRVRYVGDFPNPSLTIDGQSLGPSPYQGVMSPGGTAPSRWGHSTIYDLQVVDNQASHEPYPYGVVEEGFSGFYSRYENSSPNGGRPPGRWAAPNFQDYQTMILNHQVGLYPVGTPGWLGEENSFRGMDPRLVLEEFDQNWTHLEPPAAPVALGSHHITNYLFNTVRGGG